ncbi:transcriptional regulator, LysR family [[Leptolyngbya] sp. PCC 7376]|uniref:LysR family transcriptional regulator n=1 Tax=[Leptolyngbya] sp. PCC 7376 TaxID=111781 RepID=UPI00029F2DAF|nr:LysR family transcriptional regulator [[Leptolyngbya] sp. PCC 7376]AFY40384.1 transcriptional regulator, LysR family [[Leptolyngbya] sp. PCC 7376]
MEFKHLQTFQAVATEGSFLKAAEKLKYAQSTITLHIQKLEKELGVQLFSRQNRRTELTVAGRTLQSHAEHLLYRAEQLQQTMTGLVTGEAGQLRIGSVEPVASVHLPTVLVEFCRQYPKVRLTLEVGVTRTISRRVASGKLDLAICSPPAANLGLDFHMLFQDPISLLLPKSHMLTTSQNIAITDLSEERLILTEEHCPYRDVLEKALLSHNINPYSGVESMSSGALKQMVCHGLGIGILPTAAINPLPNKTVERHLSDLDLYLSIGLAINPDIVVPGSALASLATAIKNHFNIA